MPGYDIRAVQSPRRRLAAALGAAAAALLAASLVFPYWQARLYAPQYRHGLTVTMYAYKVTGDVEEIDTLNHYIGMAKFDTLAPLERRAAVPAVLGLSLLCLWAVLGSAGPSRWLKAFPVALYPAVFVADMAWWMRHASTNLDPTAPLKLKPFFIPVIGAGKVAQFRSQLGPMPGFWMAVSAVLLLLAALWLLRKRDPEPPIAPATRAAKSVPAALLLLVALWSIPGCAATLQEHIDAAAPGSTLELEPGAHAGPVTIVKPLVLRGRGRAVVDGRGRGTVVTVRAPGVALEGLVIRGSGQSLLDEDSGVRVEAASVVVRGCAIEDVLFGVFLVNASGAVVEDNTLRGKPLEIGRRGDLVRSWNSDRVVLRRNRMDGGRDAVLWFSTGSVVEGNLVTGGRYGLHFMYTNGARVAGNRFSENSVGAYIMYSRGVVLAGNNFEHHRGPSGAGLGLKESDSITVEDNLFTGNRQAVFIDQSPTVPENVNRFTRNRVAFNDVGLALMPGVQGNEVWENSFEDNLQQVSVRGGGVPSGNAWSRGGRGNFWSDYAGYGPAGAEVGRMPYRAGGVLERLAERRPALKWLMYTPAAQAVELAARAFPLFKPRPSLTDPHPLLRSPVAERRAAFTLAGLWLPAGMFSAAGLLTLLMRRRPASRPAGRVQAGTAPALLAEGVGKSFGKRRILGGLSLRVEPGECVVLWGANGAGKSTFLRCVLGLLSFEGAISVFGRDARSEGVDARARIGYLAQQGAAGDWTVLEAMEFVCAVRGADPAVIGGRLAACGLAGEEGKRVSVLSGGMRQKLALAQALAADPDLLLLDEPCASLDLAARRDLMSLLKALKGRKALLLTSHRIEEVETLADRVLWMEEGRPPRTMGPKAFLTELAAKYPLWVRLEEELGNAAALDLLRARGFDASPNGHGIWVGAVPGRAMEVIRLLERAGLAVRDLRREEP